MFLQCLLVSTEISTRGVVDPAPGHPFDLTKTRLQTAAPGQYSGAIDVVRKAIARDGVTGYSPPSIVSGVALI